MAKRMSIQVLARYIADSGIEPKTVLDTTNDGFDALDVSGFVKHREEDFELAAAADDEEYAFTDAIGLLVFSDLPIGIRLADAESLVEKVRFFGWVNDGDIDHTTHTTSILLTNDNTGAANVRVVVIEKTET